MKTNSKILLLLILITCTILNLSAKNVEVTKENERAGKEELYNDFKNSSLLNNSNPFDTEYNLKLMNIQVDVLGFLFFGPQVGVDFQIANIVAVGPYVRWNYAGLIYQGIITDWFSNETAASPASYGIGVSAKVIPPIGSGKHRPYFGIGIEKFKGKESWDPGGTWGRHYYEYKSNVYYFSAGYRMLTDGSFNLSVGIFLGLQIETEDKDYYEFGDGVEYNTLDDPKFGGGLQLSLGWQLGK